jgi:hypothetical protein
MISVFRATLHCAGKPRAEWLLREFQRRIRDELLNKSLFFGLDHARTKSRTGPTITTSSVRTRAKTSDYCSIKMAQPLAIVTRLENLTSRRSKVRSQNTIYIRHPLAVDRFPG